MKETTILLAEEDEHTLKALSTKLQREGYTVYSCRDGEQAWSLVQTHNPRLVIAELELHKINGMLLLERIKQLLPQIHVILITAHGSIRNAVRSMKLGATDYFTKPINLKEMVKLVHSSMNGPASAPRLNLSRERDEEGYDPQEIMIGASSPMWEIFHLVKRVSRSGSNILITGETGTGKELVAQAVHKARAGQQNPLVTIDCAAIPENLLESELFGYARGAFTGANRSKAGQIEQAHGGTLFLDEIGEMPLSLQKKMLRFLQEKAFVRVGDTRLRRVDLRIIAATNKNLENEISRGAWREDLYYRLNVIRIDIPPLRERKEDIPPLVEAFLAKYAPHYNPVVRRISQEAMEILIGYDWPGNVRELENVMERTVVLAGGETVTPSCLPDNLIAQKKGTTRPEGQSLPEMERSLLQQTLHRTQGNQSAAARELGISRKQLRTKLARHGMLRNHSG